MHIGINALGLVPGMGCEEAVHLRTLLKHLRAVQPDDTYVVFTDPVSHEAFDACDRVCVEAATRRLRGQPLKPLYQAVQDARVDLLFSPIETVSAASPVPLVLFTLNVGWVVEGAESRSWRGASRLRDLKQTCEKARAIVVQSEVAVRALMESLAVPLEKVTVAPPGVDPAIAAPQRGFVQQPYLLVAGSDRVLSPDKARSVFKTFERDFPCSVVVLGRPANEDAAGWAKNVLWIDQAPVAQLAALYQHCELMLCPSFFPMSLMRVLEGLRASAPTVLPRGPEILEVAGATPAYYDPKVGLSMLEVVRQVLRDPRRDTNAKLKAGAARAAEFTWENCARKTLRAFTRR